MAGLFVHWLDGPGSIPATHPEDFGDCPSSSASGSGDQAIKSMMVMWLLCPCRDRCLLPGIEQPFQSRVAAAQFPGSLPARKPSGTEALHHLSELLRELVALIHPGPADTLALMPRPLHASHHQIPVDLLPGWVLLPDGLAGQRSWRHQCSDPFLGLQVRRIRVGKDRHHRTGRHSSPQFSS